jgi:hypothetical protein
VVNQSSSLQAKADIDRKGEVILSLEENKEGIAVIDMMLKGQGIRL